MLVAGTLSQVSRLSYGLQLGAVSQWCDEHGLSLLGLSPLDIGALVVARRDGGQTPRSMLSALSFVYRNKADPDSARCQLARRVDRIWKVQNREHLPPPKQAPVLPLAAWAAMHAAAGDPDDARPTDPYGEERRTRNRLIVSLGLTGGLRPGDLGKLSAPAARIDAGRRLILPLAPGGAGSVTKTGLRELVVPLGVAPLDVLPLGEDFQRLQRLRLQRGGDHLVADAIRHGDPPGGLCTQSVRDVLRRLAHVAGIENPRAVSGHSLRRSMVHLSAAAGWTLDQTAAVVGHSSTSTLEDHYLVGYGANWCRSDEGRRRLLDSTRGWADIPANAAFAAAAAARPAAPGPWWSGRDLDADRRRAEQIARSAPRFSSSIRNAPERIARSWEAFCEQVGADPNIPDRRLLEGFAISLTKDSTGTTWKLILYLSDYFAALPSTDLNDLAEIRSRVAAAVRLGRGITAANRRRGWDGPRRREIVHATDEMMEAAFSQPLVSRTERTRLLGLVLEDPDVAHIGAGHLRDPRRRERRVEDPHEIPGSPCAHGGGEHLAAQLARQLGQIAGDRSGADHPSAGVLDHVLQPGQRQHLPAGVDEERPGVALGVGGRCAAAGGAHLVESGLAQRSQRSDRTGRVARTGRHDDPLATAPAGRVQHGVVAADRDVSECQTAQPGGSQREVGVASESDRNPHRRGPRDRSPAGVALDEDQLPDSHWSAGETAHDAILPAAPGSVRGASAWTPATAPRSSISEVQSTTSSGSTTVPASQCSPQVSAPATDTRRHGTPYCVSSPHHRPGPDTGPAPESGRVTARPPSRPSLSGSALCNCGARLWRATGASWARPWRRAGPAAAALSPAQVRPERHRRGARPVGAERPCRGHPVRSQPCNHAPSCAARDTNSPGPLRAKWDLSWGFMSTPHRSKHWLFQSS